MSRPGDMLRDAVRELIDTPRNIGALLGLLDDNPRRARSELASRIVEATGKKRASVLRSLERYTAEDGRQRRAPSAEYRQLIRDALLPELTNRVVDRMSDVGIVVDVEAEIIVSSDRRDRTVDGQYVSGAALRSTTFPTDAKRGRWGTAADAFAAAWGDAYMRSAVRWEDVDYLALRWPRKGDK